MALHNQQTAPGRTSSRSSIARRYRKKVVLEDGTVVKDYGGPLDRGHGDSRGWPTDSGG